MKKIKINIICLLAILVLFIGCVSEEPTKKVSSSSSQSSSSQKNSDVKSTKAQTSTTLPTELNLKVGETAQTSDLEITLTSYSQVKRYTYSNEYIPMSVQTAPSGKEYLLVEVEIKNSGDNGEYITSSSFTATDGEGYQYDVEPMYMGNDRLDLLKEINPGRKTKGKILFEIPEDAKDITVEYDFGNLFTGVKLVTWELT